VIAWLVFGLSGVVWGESFHTEVSLGYSSVAARQAYQRLGVVGEGDRLVRRYHHGRGWEYLLVSDVFGSVDPAKLRGERWTQELGHGAAVYRKGREGSGSLISITPQLSPTAEVLTARLYRTLGGRAGGLQRLSGADSVHFIYERSVQEGGVNYAMRHAFQRHGSRVDMTIEPLGNVGVGSRLHFDGERAQVWTDEEAVLGPDAEGVMDLLSRLGPSGIFGFVLELPGLLKTGELYQGLEMRESLERAGRGCAVLTSSNAKGGVQLVIDALDWWLLEASILGNMGLVTYRFGDWREIDTNLAVPFELELVRDGVVLEKIRVLELSLSSADSRYRRPSPSLLNPQP